MLFSFQVASKILDVIVDGNLSFEFAQLKSLQTLLETIGRRKIIIPSTHKIKSQLDLEYNKIKSTLMKHIAKQNDICMTTDVWTSHAQSYLGATVHFINESFERESYLLAFRRLLGRQTYDVLANEMNTIMKDYGIELRQVRNIVTDGGSAFCKMFKEFGETQDVSIVVTSDANNSVELTTEDINEVAHDTEDTMTIVMRDEYGDEYTNEILNLDIEPGNRTSEADCDFDNELQNYFGECSSNSQQQARQPDRIRLPPQRRCQSHVLNLLPSDFEKHLEGIVKNAYKYTFEALHSLWAITRASSYAREICHEILGLKMKFPCVTRWNSLIDCICQLNKPEIQCKLNDLIAALKNRLSSQSSRQLRFLNSKDFTLMNEYEKVFSPIAKALDVLQGEKNNSQGWILPVLFSMKERISQIEETHNVNRDFKSLMLNLIQNRFGDCFEFNSSNKDFILSAVSLPRFKMNFISREEDKLFVKNLLIAECKKLCEESDDDCTDVQTADCSLQDDDFIISYPTNQSVRRNSLNNKVESEVSQFLLDTRTQSHILNEYNYIKPVFLKYNATLSASAAVERVFSQSALVFTPRRNRLSNDSFEKVLVIKHNKKLMENVTIKL